MTNFNFNDNASYTFKLFAEYCADREKSNTETFSYGNYIEDHDYAVVGLHNAAFYYGEHGRFFVYAAVNDTGEKWNFASGNTDVWKDTAEELAEEMVKVALHTYDDDKAEEIFELARELFH